jgi:hypothetical protein
MNEHESKEVVIPVKGGGVPVVLQGPVDLAGGALPVAALIRQVKYVDDLFKGVLIEGTDYGRIPGMPREAKPTLFQPGAQMLCRGLQLSPSYEVQSATRNARTVAYVITCVLTHYSTGRIVGSGVGACNTDERKYQRTLMSYAAKARPGEPAVSAMDLENTILKMATKRALVHATLNVAAASRVFAEIEEEPEKEEAQGPQAQTHPTQERTPGAEG